MTDNNKEQLSTAKPFTDEQAHVITAMLLKLNGLGIKAKFLRVQTGPVVTGYHFKPDAGQPIAKLLKHEEDFALAAGVESCTVSRERGEVIIFIPNKERKLINFKDSLYWLGTDPLISKMKLPVSLGVNYLGEKAALDLTEQPHILIAGQTGAGKSILESSIIASLAVLKDPSEMHLYLVDTKRLDLTLFEELPHVKDVAKDVAQFHAMFTSILLKTRQRMLSIENARVRNISEYNALPQNENHPMPYMVVVIDELADVIMQDKNFRKVSPNEAQKTPSVPQYLQELVQISRAAGVHIIACTQRSSVTIISGDIKANLPCRIALRLPTRDDSKTILGTNGAESLLGKGDMLVQRPDSETIDRFHGPFVDLHEIRSIIRDQYRMREVFQNLAAMQAQSAQQQS